MDSFVVIALSSIKGIGAKTLVKCRESLKQWVLNEPQDILEILRQLVSEGKIPTKFTDVSSKEAEEAFQKTAGIFADMEEKGIKVVTLLESTYPEGFHELNRPPVAIYFKRSNPGRTKIYRLRRLENPNGGVKLGKKEGYSTSAEIINLSNFSDLDPSGLSFSEIKEFSRDFDGDKSDLVMQKIINDASEKGKLKKIKISN